MAKFLGQRTKEFLDDGMTFWYICGGAIEGIFLCNRIRLKTRHVPKMFWYVNMVKCDAELFQELTVVSPHHQQLVVHKLVFLVDLIRPHNNYFMVTPSITQ